MNIELDEEMLQSAIQSAVTKKVNEWWRISGETAINNAIYRAVNQKVNYMNKDDAIKSLDTKVIADGIVSAMSKDITEYFAKKYDW